jgi:hypothetical protein
MFVSGLGSSHVSYPRFQAAVQAHDLAFILRHSGQITMGLRDEIEVCRLIAEQDPGRFEPASARWIQGFAGRLVVLCGKRGLG